MYKTLMSTGLQQQTLVTVTDPATGKPVQQAVQTVTDPKTGETKQIVMMGGQPCQLVTSNDPVTGLPVQQVVQTDPKTGQSNVISVTETHTSPSVIGTFYVLNIACNFDFS